MSTKVHLPLALLLLLATVLVYAPSLTPTLVFDDYVNLLPLEELAPGEEAEVIFGNGAGLLGRPLAMASFVLDRQLFGFDVPAFKRTNLLIHLLCGLLLLPLSRRLLSAAGLGREAASWTALWITALWLLTPMAVSSVLYTVQRMAQLAALFSFAGLLSYAIGRAALIEGRRTGWWGVAAAWALFLPLAASSKENGALLPLLLLVTEWCLFRFDGPAAVRKGLIALFLATVALPALLVLLLLPGWWSEGAYALRDFTLAERLMSEARILWEYAGRLLWPVGGGYGIYHDDYAISHGLLEPPTTLLALLGLGLIALPAFCPRTAKYRPLLFGPLLFLAGHAMESTLFPLELYFEHRNYLPGFGLFFALGLGTARLAASWPAQRRWLGVAALLLLYLHGAASAGVAETWRYPQMLAWFSAEHHLDSPRLLLDLADVRASEGRLERAMALLEKAARLKPAYAPAVAVAGLSAACFVGKPPPPGWLERLEESFAEPRAARRPATLAAMVKLHQLAEFQVAFGCPGLELGRLEAVWRPWLARIEGDPGMSRLIRKELTRIFTAGGRY